MLLIFLYGIFSTLPFNSAMITCRVACRHCRDNTAYPEMLEVYCAMCDECKERRREWLQGPRNLNLRAENGNYLKNDDLEDSQDDCSTPSPDDQCEEPILLTKKITSTTTITTTTTTHRPCTPKHHCVKTTARAQCMVMPCPVVAPFAIPVCQMCPALGATSTVSSSSIVPLFSHDRKAEDISTATSESMYFYVGLPKKLLKELKIIRS